MYKMSQCVLRCVLTSSATILVGGSNYELFKPSLNVILLPTSPSFPSPLLVSHPHLPTKTYLYYSVIFCLSRDGHQYPLSLTLPQTIAISAVKFSRMLSSPLDSLLGFGSTFTPRWGEVSVRSPSWWVWNTFSAEFAHFESRSAHII